MPGPELGEKPPFLRTDVGRTVMFIALLAGGVLSLVGISYLVSQVLP